MEDLIREAGPAEVRSTRPTWRALSIFVTVALVVGGVILARNAESSASKGDPAVTVEDGASIVDGAGAVIGKELGFGAPTAQFNVPDLIRAIVCPILTALATGPLGGFIAPVINALRVAFGCVSP